VEYEGKDLFIVDAILLFPRWSVSVSQHSQRQNTNDVYSKRVHYEGKDDFFIDAILLFPR